MKPQAQSSSESLLSASLPQDFQAAYQALARVVQSRPWIAQGSVNRVAPKSPTASVTYTWTRKVRAKTTTVALSPQQAVAFRQAIAANRLIEEALNQLRQASQETLMTQLPGVSKRRKEAPPIT